MVVVDGVGEVLEDGGDAEEDDVEQHIQQVAEGQAGHHSLLKFLLFLFSVTCEAALNVDRVESRKYRNTKPVSFRNRWVNYQF